MESFPRERLDRRPEIGRAKPCARLEGFSLHTATCVHENDRQGLERLCRYGARPALSVERLREHPGGDGRLDYKMKRTFSDGRDTIVLDADELLTRLVALIPSPRNHQTRYHGLFAPRARRCAVVTGRAAKPRSAEGDKAAPPPRPAPAPPLPESLASSSSESLGGPPPLPDRPARLPWADLLARVHRVDVLSCPDCGGRLRVVAFLTDPDVTRTILEHLHLPSSMPPRGSPRAPPSTWRPMRQLDL